MKILLVGSTGLVGSEVLKILLSDARVKSVVTPVRKKMELSHPQLIQKVIDFDQLQQDSQIWGVDVVICTLGTTIKIAKTKENFKKVDLTYPVEVAKLCHQFGARHFILNSAMGANAKSKIFYNQVKGEAELAIQQIGYSQVTLVRPGLIGGERKEFRLGEQIAHYVLSFLDPILPAKMKINPAQKIAQKICEQAFIEKPGIQIVEADQMTEGKA